MKAPMKDRQTTASKRQTVTRLGLALAAYQQKYDIANGRMAKEIGITGSMLSRIKGGTKPGGNGLAKILLWLSKIDREFEPQLPRRRRPSRNGPSAGGAEGR
jgi:hypothetical protein